MSDLELDHELLERQVDADRRERRRRRRRRSGITLLVCLVVVAVISLMAWKGLRPLVDQLTASNDYPGPGTGQVDVTVSQGDTTTAIADKLVSADVVKSAKAFLSAATNDNRAAGIQPGRYQLKQHMPASDALVVLADPANRIVTKITIPEGMRLKEILGVLVRKGGFTPAEVTAAAKNAAAIGLPASAHGNPEGYLFPATYELTPGGTAVQALSAMVKRMQQELASEGVSDAAAHRVLTKASIIQAEGANPTDFGKISQAIDNRLAKNMKLQLDSTVSYAVQRFGVTTTPAERAVKSPYNTYVYPGLPVGPIGNPGAAAIKAALHPTPGPWLYWVTVNPTTGETKFAATLPEHQAHVREFQAWLKANG